MDVLDSLITTFFDSQSGLTCSNKGDVYINVYINGMQKNIKIGYLCKVHNIINYIQPEKVDHILKIYDAWTLDKIIFDKLPDSAIIKFKTKNLTYSYTKQAILDSRNNVNPLEMTYIEKNFKGYNTRIILPLKYGKIT